MTQFERGQFDMEMFAGGYRVHKNRPNDEQNHHTRNVNRSITSIYVNVAFIKAV